VFAPDNSHLRKYLATLGVAIVAGTLSLAGLFLKLQQDLLVTPDQLSKTTPIARKAIETRQEYLAIATSWLPLAVLAGILIGLALSAYGLAGWHKRQLIADAREENARDKEVFEFKTLSDSEKLAKLDREAAEEVVEAEQEEASAPSRSESDAPVDSALSSAPTGMAGGVSKSVDFGFRFAALETTFARRLRHVLPEDWDVRSGLRLGSAHSSRWVEVDLAVFDGRETPKFLYELKFVRDASMASRRLRETAKRMADWPDAGNAQQVLVIAVDGLHDKQRNMLQGQAMNYLSGLKRPIHVVFVDVEQLETMSDDEFLRRFGVVSPSTRLEGEGTLGA
jgi:hypothetical protein